METPWTPVPLDEVKDHIRWLQEAAEQVEAGWMEAVRYEGDGFNISFRITPAGIRQIEAAESVINEGDTMDLMCGGREWHLWEHVTGGGWYARLWKSSPPVVLREPTLGGLIVTVTHWRGRG